MKCLQLQLLLAVLLFTPVLRANMPPATRKAEHFPEYDSNSLIEMMHETKVIATITESCVIYKGMSGTSGAVTKLSGGAKVEIIKDYRTEWYFVEDTASGRRGWVECGFLDIPPEPPVNKNLMNKAQLEGYVNAMTFSSGTAYFVLVDIDRQQTHIFKGAKSNWSLEKTLECSTGKNQSPTLRGSFELVDRGLWFYSGRLGSGGKYWVRYNDSYLFHSVAMDKDGNITDDTIGEKSSSGCVRFSIPDAKWFYETVPDKTGVVIM